ncbi:MAG: hypothetical protein RLZZ543_1490 [Bacteroidota bacterium]|jgi:CYTH domain-containing protein
MAIEIENKYLVNTFLWNSKLASKSYVIRQAYMHSDPSKTIRVRTKGLKGFITVKGKNTGAARAEFEYEIPLSDAIEMIHTFCSNVIEKTRYEVEFAGKCWEVDVFEGDNEGLIIAEIELNSETEAYELPLWVKENVTADMRYANSNLAAHPYKKWD